MSAVVEQVAVGALTELVRHTFVEVFNAIRSRSGKPGPSGSREERLAAYQAFRTASVEIYTDLLVLGQVRSNPLGLLLTLPLKLSIFWRLPSNLARFQDSTLGVCMVGSASVIGSAELFAEKLNAAAASPRPKAWQMRAAPDVTQEWELASSALGAFVASARADLEIQSVQANSP